MSSKVRIIPSILTKRRNQVKGQSFDNWRVVGTPVSSSKVHAAREVDELLLLDVQASLEGRVIKASMVSELAKVLRIPFSVGGGVTTLVDIAELFRNGADKVIIGRGWRSNKDLIRSAADVFGVQAISVTLDVLEEGGDEFDISGSVDHRSHPNGLIDCARYLEDQGAGEIILQCKELDGKMMGMDWNNIEKVSRAVGCRVVASSGAGSAEDFERSFSSGASGVAAGAVFQFTQLTPLEIKRHLKVKGWNVRA